MKTVRRSRRPRRPAWGKLAIIAIAIASLFALWRYTPLAEIATVDNTLDLARRVGDTPWSPLIVLAVYTPAAFVMFPRPLITLFAVIAYGPWLGFGTAMAGILVSAVCTYYTGGALPENTLRKLAGDKFERAMGALRGRGFAASFAVSIAPVAPFPVIGMVAGAAAISLWQYLAGMALGMLPGTLATTVFADQLKNALEDPSKINYWIVIGVIAVFVALMLGVRRWLLNVQGQPARG